MVKGDGYRYLLCLQHSAGMGGCGLERDLACRLSGTFWAWPDGGECLDPNSCLPNHIAQLNAEHCYEHQGFKENKALCPALVLQVKRLHTLQESNHTIAINSLLN